MVDKKLVVDPQDAKLAIEVFETFLREGSLLTTAEALTRKGRRTKQGRAWTKNNVRGHLGNVLYIGQVALKGETFAGQHEAIVDQKLWDAVHAALRDHAPERRRPRSRSTALLAGVLRCGQCGSNMTRHTASKGNYRHGSYVCLKMQKEGAAACRGSRAPQRAMDEFVIERIRCIGRDPDLLHETIEAARTAEEQRRPEIEAELQEIAAEKRRIGEERNTLLQAIEAGGTAVPTLAKKVAALDQREAETNGRRRELRADLDAIEAGPVDGEALRTALAEFDGVWGELRVAEQQRLLRLLLEEVCYDAAEEQVTLRFRKTGIQTIAEESET